MLQGVRPLPWHAQRVEPPAQLRSDAAEPAAQAAADRQAALAAALAAAQGSSNTSRWCYLDVACAGPGWDAASRGVVLLVLASRAGARFCTGARGAQRRWTTALASTAGWLHRANRAPALGPAGALLNTAHLPRGSPTYILSANHCLGFDSEADAALYYSVIFNHQRPACASAEPPPALGANRRLLGGGDSGGGAALPAVQEVQGLQVAWQDEASDVLLLRLASGVPAEFGAAALGWSAGAWAPEGTAVATMSHPRGDLKQLASSAAGLRRARSSAAGGGSQAGSDATHYKASGVRKQSWVVLPAAAQATHPALQVRWEVGGTDTGSSGAPLLDAASQQALGVLTGGEDATCLNRDYFGSLHAVGVAAAGASACGMGSRGARCCD